jgi:hypothetical protein
MIFLGGFSLGVQELKFKRWLMAMAMASFAILLLASSLASFCHFEQSEKSENVSIQIIKHT